MSNAGPVWTGEVRFNRQWLRQPSLWTRPRLIFVAAHGDLFHPGVTDAQLDEVFGVMALCRRHLFQVLTKRVDRAAEYLDALPARQRAWACDSGLDFVDLPLSNVMIGASVEDQTRADERRPALRRIAELGWRTWVSYEPALGLVDWAGWHFIEFLVSGGEAVQSTACRARPGAALLHRAARDWAETHRVRYHFKQWGDWIDADHWFGRIAETCGTIMRGGARWTPHQPLTFEDAKVVALISGARPVIHCSDGTSMIHVGKRAAGAVLDGREWRDMPRAS